MNGATTQLTQPQRKALADMIHKYSGDVWERAKDKYDETRTSRREAVIREVGGVDVVKAKDNIVTLRSKINAVERELEERGFKVEDDGTLDLVHHYGHLDQAIEKRLDAEVGTKDEVLNRAFDNARVQLLLAATAEEAERIVEPLLNFEVKVK